MRIYPGKPLGIADHSLEYRNLHDNGVIRFVANIIRVDDSTDCGEFIIDADKELILETKLMK